MIILKKCRLAILVNWIILLLTGFSFGAEIILPHVPWKLEGANERIEKYRKGTIQLKIKLENDATIPEKTMVQIKQINHNFNWGGSLTQVWTLHKHKKFQEYLDAFKDIFNYSTIGFYWNWHEKTQGKWIFSDYCENALSFAKKNNMVMRGHPLMWHNTLPNWLNKIENEDTLTKLVDAHVNYLINKYPQIDQWDLYNEAPSINKTYVKTNSPGKRYLLHNGGLEKGMLHIHKTALKANKKGSYLVNHHKINDEDYHTMIKYLLKKRIEIPAIGIQTHMYQKDQVLKEKYLWEQLERYAQYKVPIHLSEVTVLSSKNFEDWNEMSKWQAECQKAQRNGRYLTRPSTKEGEKYQAEYLKDFYTLAFSHPAVDTIVYWNVSDYHFWRGSQGGLLDQDNNPKPAYKTLKNLIKNKWWTKESRVAEKGIVQFRGFLGSYRIQIKIGNDYYATEFNLNEKSAGKSSSILLKKVRK